MLWTGQLEHCLTLDGCSANSLCRESSLCGSLWSPPEGSVPWVLTLFEKFPTTPCVGLITCRPAPHSWDYLSSSQSLNHCEVLFCYGYDFWEKRCIVVLVILCQVCCLPWPFTCLLTTLLFCLDIPDVCDWTLHVSFWTFVNKAAHGSQLQHQSSSDLSAIYWISLAAHFTSLTEELVKTQQSFRLPMAYTRHRLLIHHQLLPH